MPRKLKRLKPPKKGFLKKITKKAPPGKGSSAKRKPSQAYRGKKKGISRSKSALKRVRYR